ncbi:hypothetical protein EVAR_7498_1 [Eumeta japonica]|uniref:Uncharacterized protein n=1 Tax=Eumeta variegata TaxID=151549 RepID=A0A4C1Y1Y3_EUMVA|nr:hypothetical protein EVAR_7498_1 [Eumeta japonica]
MYRAQARARDAHGVATSDSEVGPLVKPVVYRSRGRTIVSIVSHGSTAGRHISLFACAQSRVGTSDVVDFDRSVDLLIEFSPKTTITRTRYDVSAVTIDDDESASWCPSPSAIGWRGAKSLLRFELEVATSSLNVENVPNCALRICFDDLRSAVYV